MSPLEREIMRQFQRRAAEMSPDLASAILNALAEIRKAIEVGNIARAVEAGNFIAQLDKALADPVFTKVRTEIRHSLQQAIKYAAADLPKSGRINGQISVMFDVLNPVHIEAVRILEGKVITTLKDEIRDVVRAHVENGLRDGVGPRAVARGIREVVGLAPNQLEAVENFRKALQEGDVAKAMGYKLRDSRFKITKDLSPEKIDKMVDAYRKRFIAHHAETVARTTTLNAMKKGQQLAQQDAVDKGILDPNRLVKTWIQVDRPTKRKSHIPLNGETVPYNMTYSNGDMIPGENDYNCACLSRFHQTR